MKIELVKGIGTCKFCEEKKSSWHIISKGNKGFICEDCISSLPYLTKQFKADKEEYNNQCKDMYTRNIAWFNDKINECDNEFLYKLSDSIKVGARLSDKSIEVIRMFVEREINIKELEKIK